MAEAAESESRATRWRRFVWDGEKGLVLGRQPKAWALLATFYGVFYGVLLLFFLASVNAYVAARRLDATVRGPIYNDILVKYPGLAVRPQTLSSSSQPVALIHVRGDDATLWTERVAEFLAPYTLLKRDAAVDVDCTVRTPRPGQFCHFRLDALGENCTAERAFGYDRGQPCVLLKLNRIYGWAPQPYHIDDLPNTMPDELKEHVNETQRSDMAWLHCTGETDADQERMGPVSYAPFRGFPVAFFPQKRALNYIDDSPLVALQFHGPRAGVDIGVVCHVFARNIEHRDGDHHTGSTHFRLRID